MGNLKNYIHTVRLFGQGINNHSISNLHHVIIINTYLKTEEFFVSNKTACCMQPQFRYKRA